MTKLVIIFRYIALFTAIFLLSGCLGGTVAQQIARSIATHVADKAMARAMDVDEDQTTSNRNTAYKNAPPQAATLQSSTKQVPQANNTELNDYTYAMATFGFETVKPITEPLPNQAQEAETLVQVVQTNQLVRVELFNLLIGDEKNAFYEKARLIGATSLPQKREWQNWAVGTGVVEKDKKIITFLIPPEFGKLPSGAVAVVELANPGELNVARYKASKGNELKLTKN